MKSHHPYKVLLTLPAFLFLSQSNASAQAPPIVWQQCYGGDSADYIMCINQATGGGYIAAGTTRSSDGDLAGNGGIKGLWVLKLDGLGNITWEKTYNDTMLVADYIESTYDGGYILTGSQTLKLDNSGNIQWSANVPGRVIHQAADSGYIIACGETPALVKLAANGSISWQQSYDGGGDDVNVYDVCPSFYGNGYLIAGSIDDIYNSPFIAKTDNSGNLLAPIDDDYSHGLSYHLCKTNDGNYLCEDNGITGFSVAKVSDTLSEIWTTGLINLSSAGSITGTGDNGFIAWGTGIYSGNSDMTLLKFNAAGAQQWLTYISGTETGTASYAIQNTGGNYVVAGSISENDSDVSGAHGSYDGWVALLGSDEGVPVVKNTAGIKVYPVPATNQLFIDLPAGYADAKLRLIDAGGKTWIEENSNTLLRTLDLSHLSAGEYLLEVVNAGNYSSYKVVHY